MVDFQWISCGGPCIHVGPDHADLQKFLAGGGRPTTSLEMQIKPPEMYGISKIPQPSSAAMLLQHDQRSEQSGSSSFLRTGPLQADTSHPCTIPSPV